MPVDWDGITARGVTATNYQIFPGDQGQRALWVSMVRYVELRFEVELGIIMLSLWFLFVFVMECERWQALCDWM